MATEQRSPQPQLAPPKPNELRVGQRRSIIYVKSAETLFLTHDEVILCGLGNSMSLFLLFIHLFVYYVRNHNVV